MVFAVFVLRRREHDSVQGERAFEGGGKKILYDEIRLLARLVGRKRDLDDDEVALPGVRDVVFFAACPEVSAGDGKPARRLRLGRRRLGKLSRAPRDVDRRLAGVCDFRGAAASPAEEFAFPERARAVDGHRRLFAVRGDVLPAVRREREKRVGVLGSRPPREAALVAARGEIARELRGARVAGLRVFEREKRERGLLDGAGMEGGFEERVRPLHVAGERKRPREASAGKKVERFPR